VHLAGADGNGGVVDGAPLHRRRPGRHADQDARSAEAEHGLGALDELAQHLLGGDEVGDDTVAQRPQKLHALRHAPDQRLGLAADGYDLAGAAIGAHGHDGRLVDDDAAPCHVHQRVGRAEVDRYVVREGACHIELHGLLATLHAPTLPMNTIGEKGVPSAARVR
jgi:hypothetical protein